MTIVIVSVKLATVQVCTPSSCRLTYQCLRFSQVTIVTVSNELATVQVRTPRAEGGSEGTLREFWVLCRTEQ